MYIKALIDGLFPSPPKDIEFRGQLEKESEENGLNALYKRLKIIDASSASLIHPNDKKRIIRALEIYHITGIALSEHKKNTKGIKDLYKIVQLGVKIPREKLYENINKRVEKMFQDNILKEAKKLLNRKLSLTAKSAIGIKEMKDYFDGKYTLEELKALIKQNTRRYAKRQMTWFRKDKRIKWIKGK